MFIQNAASAQPSAQPPAQPLLPCLLLWSQLKPHDQTSSFPLFVMACKAFTRKNCDYSWNALKSIVPIALSSVYLTRVRKFARKSERYIDAYRPKDGDVRLTAAQVEYAVKKYRSHRKIPGKIMTEL